jgi:hypothetical protein
MILAGVYKVPVVRVRAAAAACQALTALLDWAPGKVRVQESGLRGQRSGLRVYSL